MVRLTVILLCLVCSAESTYPDDFGSNSNTQVFGPSGKLTFEGSRVTTKAYEREALRLIIDEANKVAQILRLPEKMPIAEANLKESFILGYGMSQLPPKMLGNIHTKSFGYYVSVGHKLSYIERTDQDTLILKWSERYRWPRRNIDTNSAYQLATQWLGNVSIDVESLNRDCRLLVGLEDLANHTLTDNGKFVPVYEIRWLTPKRPSDDDECVATVKLFLPHKELISLRVEESKYILRPPLVFTNLTALLAQPASKKE